MFGKVKNNLDTVLVNTFNNKPVFKNAFHSLMNALKENKQSREFFILYSQVENKRFDDKSLAEAYLTQVIKILKSKKKNLKTNTVNNTNSKFKPYITETTNKIYNHLDLLVFNESVKRIDSMVKGRKELLNHLTRKSSIQLKESNVPNSLLINVATRKFNERFDNLSSGDKKKFKELYSKGKEELYEEYQENINEAITKLDSLIKETSDSKLTLKLEETKHKINEGNFSKNSLLKIKELNKTIL